MDLPANLVAQNGVHDRAHDEIGRRHCMRVPVPADLAAGLDLEERST